MTYINRINQAVSELRLKNPNHEIFPILERYNPAGNHGGSYLALDRLGFDIGIMPGYTQYVCTETGEEDGVAATLLYRPSNIVGREEGEIELKEFPAGEQGFEDCFVHGALHQLEEIMRIPCLNERLLARKSK